MGKRSFTNGVVGALAIAAAAGCGDPFTLAMTSSSSGSNSSMAAGSGGSDGGGAGGGGSVAQCTPDGPTVCSSGQYCRRDKMICADCKEVLSRFSFGAPRPITLPLPTGSSNPRFPRSGPDGQLLFTFTTSLGNQDIGHATPSSEFLKWEQVESEPPQVNTLFDDASSLYLPDGKALASLIDANVDTTKGIELYDSNAQGGRKIFAFNPGETNLSNVKLSQGTVNAHLTLAHKLDPPRLWYISNALKAATDPDDFVELVTAKPGGTPEEVSLTDSAGCPVSGDITPWVTPDGNILLFSSKRQEKGDGGACTSAASEALHISYIPMNPMTGQQTDMEQARELFPNETRSYTAPALREDLCVLYFFENISADKSQLYAAVRE